MALLRTPEVEQQYSTHITQGGLTKTCALCDKPSLQSFVHWKIVTNDYPYGRIADKHHMLVPVRHVRESALSEEEYAELIEIKNSYVAKNYEYLMESAETLKSIPTHFHIHLVVMKTEQK